MNTPLKLKQPSKPKAQKPSPLQSLLMIEGEAMNAKDLLSLKHVAVNRPRTLMPVGHIIWVSRKGQSVS